MAKILKKLKNNNGFSLLEIVISVATISLVGVFIVQMFIASSTLNMRAKAVDNATAQACSIVEKFKAIAELSPVSYAEYYDKNWKKVEKDEESKKYRLNAEVYADQDDKEEKEAGVIYSISVEVVEFTDGKGSTNGEKVIAELQTKKYLPNDI